MSRTRMNIEVKGRHIDLVEKICKETEMSPPQLMEYVMDFMQHVYSDFEREKNAGIEKGSFKEILTNLFFDLSNLRTIEERLIRSTNELLRIEEYVDAGIYNIDLDFSSRSFFYTVGYKFSDAAKVNAFKGLLVNIELNQDYIRVAHVLYLFTVESMEISDKKTNDTSSFAQEFIRDINREEFSPFVNFDVEMFPIADGMSGKGHTIGIKLIVKADKATHMPSLGTISHIIREVHGIVINKLVPK
jgi:hypothetical protein